MKIFSELEVGDKLSIEIDQIDLDIDMKQNNILNTQLIDKDNNYLYISSPVYMGQRYFLRNGQKVTLFFYRKKGVYQFDAQVIKQVDTNIVTFILKPIGDMLKIQRRSYYRLPIVVTAVLKKIQNEKLIAYDCVTKDLSGGGVKVVCKNEFQMFDNIVIDLNIDGNQVITMDGEIVRVIKSIEKNSYELGIKFKETNPVGSDKIFAFIFEKQRLMRQKGLI